MRQNRIAAVIATLVVGATTSLAGAAAADAATVTHPSVTSAAHSQTTAVQSKKRDITLSFKAFGAKSFKFTGTVTPDGEKKTVILLRSNTKKGKFTKVKQTKTNGQGEFTFGGLTKVGYYVAAVRASNGYKASVSKAHHVYRG